MVSGRPTRCGTSTGRDTDVVIHQLPFGEGAGRIEDFIQVGQLELAAVHFDDGGSRHVRFEATNRRLRVQNSSQYSCSPA